MAFAVKRLCRVLGVSRSNFYRWARAAAVRVARAVADSALAQEIRQIRTAWDGTYGSRAWVRQSTGAAGVECRQQYAEAFTATLKRGAAGTPSWSSPREVSHATDAPAPTSPIGSEA